ncbi:uncharacterized protein LOC129960349 [Argiope bruennichi]|uniref:U-scoloptoxin(01)-Er1a like protein n=1 Tax=Argiope bruennichi TaxID=94029 RepID=A0A8T0FKA3_ARGBR|nr:uncharacterized protein LOC129960349 [Argiope bruennichi]KAF8790658.1 U-scoloptoxin(01)-Er1a like protein [Argiope bruennichi]
MHLLPKLIIISAFISLGYCQFYDPDKREIRTISERPQRINSESSETQDVQQQRPRIRKYRRILREGEYIQPPQPPTVYRPSVFENIGLGEAPNGVYIPQDSLLNALKNPRYNREIPTSQYHAPQTVPPHNNYQGPSLRNNEPEYKFFVEPPASLQPRPQQNAISNVVQPNIQYASDSPVNTSPQVRNDEPTEEVPRRRVAQTNRKTQKRRPTPEVDIDALRTYPDTMPYDVEYPAPEVQPVSQPRSVSRSSRRRTRVQIYDEPTQPPRVYGPSVFQNIGLGEAPEGVHIPEDSLLNILRDPARTQSQPRYTAPDLQPSSQTQSGADMSQQNYLQPTIVDAPEPQRTPKRQSRQRVRASRTSVSSTERQVEYPINYEEQDFARISPASSQNQRRRQTNTEDSAVNRRQNVNQAQPRQSPRRQQRVQPKQSEAQPSRQQQNNHNYKPAKLALAALPEDTDGDEIPGEALVDYPTFHTIPRTAFSCIEQEYNGYYADMETSCQVVHLCQDGGVQSSFLCPNGTIFNQEKLSCQWWYKVNCANSPKFYAINSNLYKTLEEGESKKWS